MLVGVDLDFEPNYYSAPGKLNPGGMESHGNEILKYFFYNESVKKRQFRNNFKNSSTIDQNLKFFWFQ